MIARNISENGGIDVEMVEGDPQSLGKDVFSASRRNHYLVKEVQVEDHPLHLKLNNGIKVEFAPGTRAMFESALRVRLKSGEVKVDVGENKNGFTVVTEAGEIIDIGTVFKVSVQEEGQTKVDVISGEVNLLANGVNDEADTPLSLLEGNSVVLFPENMLSETQYRDFSGIYPHLAIFNNAGSCGFGGLAPWAGSLWAISNPPFAPFGSDDKLIEIKPNLQRIIRPESIGGTHINRMIHRESNQLILGSYFIDATGNVRFIPPQQLPGRICGTARHLTDPENKVYFATMDKGLYEVDVRNFNVRGLIKDYALENIEDRSIGSFGEKMNREHQFENQLSLLPGQNAMGCYTVRDAVFFTNAGQTYEVDLFDLKNEAGALGKWQGYGDWQLVRRNQFTDITGPGGIGGAIHPDDPAWTVGWDHRSLILMVYENGGWTSYRLPKGTHSADGIHGTAAGWPRIRDIGEPALLMNMHGTFWKFPRTFSVKNSAGIEPLSNYLKDIGDFCSWNDHIVFGCNDAATWPLNDVPRTPKRPMPPGVSQSNLWFVKPNQLKSFGPLIGRGAVWVDDSVAQGEVSDPYLFNGYSLRTLHLSHKSDHPVTLNLEVDEKGNGTWKRLKTVTLQPAQYQWIRFDRAETGAWIRIKAEQAVENFTAFFNYHQSDLRNRQPSVIFKGIASQTDGHVSGGLLQPQVTSRRSLWLLACDENGEIGTYALDQNMQLRPEPENEDSVRYRNESNVDETVISVDSASVIYEHNGIRYRLPKSDLPDFGLQGPLGPERVAREVVNGRDLLNAHGTFYELPTETAGGITMVRPIATHNRRIKDFTSYLGMLVISGIAMDRSEYDPHIIRSSDGRCALWLGTIDDLWQFGKPCGLGGPWHETTVQKDVPSDPYLMSGYDVKDLVIRHDSDDNVNIRIEVDLTGRGDWVNYQTCRVKPNLRFAHSFPTGFNAYWIRFIADRDVASVTATLSYQ